LEDNSIHVAELNKLLTNAPYLYIDGGPYEWRNFDNIYSCLL